MTSPRRKLIKAMRLLRKQVAKAERNHDYYFELGANAGIAHAVGTEELFARINPKMTPPQIRAWYGRASTTLMKWASEENERKIELERRL